MTKRTIFVGDADKNFEKGGTKGKSLVGFQMFLFIDIF